MVEMVVLDSLNRIYCVSTEKKSLKIIGRNLFYPFDVSTLLMFQPLLMFQLLLENWKIQIWNLKMTISN